MKFNCRKFLLFYEKLLTMGHGTNFKSTVSFPWTRLVIWVAYPKLQGKCHCLPGFGGSDCTSQVEEVKSGGLSSGAIAAGTKCCNCVSAFASAVIFCTWPRETVPLPPEIVLISKFCSSLFFCSFTKLIFNVGWLQLQFSFCELFYDPETNLGVM